MQKHLVLCMCNSKAMVFNFQQFQQILIKISSFFSARPFVSYFVLNITHRYGSTLKVKILALSLFLLFLV
jgi:hypothetical protein